MGRVFFILTTLSLMLALLTNRAPSAASALLNSAESGVSLMLTLLGTMTLWSGLMEVLLRTGDVAKLGLLIRKLFGRHSRALPDADCWEAVGMNLAANVLGLGNAATPPGVSAAKKLAVHGEPGLRVLVLLLDWRVALIAWGLFAVLWLTTRYVSLGSIAATASMPVSVFLLMGHNWLYTALSAAVAALVIWCHRGNIQRLLTGTEKKFQWHVDPLDGSK